MEKIPGSAHLNLTLGGMVIAGGIAGYVKKGSKPSLLAGIGIGSLLLGTGYLIAKTERIYEAHILGSTASGIMAMGMGHRYIMTTGKFMPAGMVALIGAAGCAYNVKKAIEWAPTKED